MPHPETFIWICILFPLISYATFRDPLHPHFVFTLCWVYLIPLGPVVNPEPADDLISLAGCDAKVLTGIHELTTIFMVLLFITSYALARHRGSTLSGGMNGPDAVKKALSTFSRWVTPAGLLGTTLLLVQILLQVSKCAWSPVLWFHFLVGPRFERPWAGSYIGGAEYIQSLVGNLFPMAGILMAYAAVFGPGRHRPVFLVLWLVHLFMLVGDGSRTPMVLSLLSWAMFWWISKRGVIRIAGAAAAVAGAVALISVMSQFRQEGIVRIAGSGNNGRIEYRQDDNYFRLVHAILTDRDKAAPRWNAGTFVGAAVVNPVPRYFWPGKPLLEQNFYGDWKLFYVTITFVGECVAMFGETLGLAAAFVAALVFQQVLARLFPVVRKPGGLILYLATAFYIYSIMRSITNLGMNMIFFAAVVGFYLILNRNTPVSPVWPGQPRQFSR
jgi:hypothetical protein